VENTIPGILLVKCYIDHRPLAVKPFATSGVTQAFLVLCQGLIILGSDAKKSQHVPYIPFDSCYVLTKVEKGVHAKFVGTPIVGPKKKAIWVPKSLVTNLQGPKHVWVPKKH